MATVHSIGLHRPSALPYLVAEGILPVDPPDSLYRSSRRLFRDQTGSEINEEVLFTAHSVVWSRENVIIRVFNLDIEAEPILHAFTTCFWQKSESYDDSGKNLSPHLSPDEAKAALVVVLKTQAHIFQLSGDTHVLPLSFEADFAFPCYRGFVLQRSQSLKLNNADVIDYGESEARSAPSQSKKADIVENKVRHQHGQPTIVLPIAPDVVQQTKHHIRAVPRTFCFTELLSEIGLVVAGSARKSEAIEELQPLAHEEEIIYLTQTSELSAGLPSKESSIHIAVTLNEDKATLSIWEVRFKGHDRPAEPTAKRRDEDANASHRKSSNIYARHKGTTTPTSRPAPVSRKSFAGLAQSISEDKSFRQGVEGEQLTGDDLVSQLGQEFEQSGMQTRSARRVSSLLARTDLGGVNDRTAFNDLAIAPSIRKSLSRSVRRGESVGSFSDRQSFGTRRRSSFHATASVISNGTSFISVGAKNFLSDTLNLDGGDDKLFEETNSRLPRDLGFMKLKSLRYHQPTSHTTTRARFKVTTISSPALSGPEDKHSYVLSICIVDNVVEEMTLVNFSLKQSLSQNIPKMDVAYSIDPKAIEIHRGSAVIDVCRVSDSGIQRLLVLTTTREGQKVLHLEAPWTPSYRLDLPTQYIFHNPWRTRDGVLDMMQEIGSRRVIPEADVRLTNFLSQSCNNTFVVDDEQGRHHALHLTLLPRNNLVRRILDMCNFVLPVSQRDSILVAWWEVNRWLKSQDEDFYDPEWISLVIVLFMMAIPFISQLQDKRALGPRRKKNSFLRSSSGSAVDMSAWTQMLEAEDIQNVQDVLETVSWSWIEDDAHSTVVTQSPSKHSRKSFTELPDKSKKNAFLIRNTNLAREFLQSPAGENATGPEGYLPTAINKDRDSRRTALATITVGLHLLREEQKVNQMDVSTMCHSSTELAALISQLALWLGWKSWGAGPDQYYGFELVDGSKWAFESSSIDTMDVPAQPFEPPSIFSSIESCSSISYPTLIDLIPHARNLAANYHCRSEGTKLTPMTFLLMGFLADAGNRNEPEAIVEHMLECGIDANAITKLPDGVATAFHQAIAATRPHPPVEWSSLSHKLLNRRDLDFETHDRKVLRHQSSIRPSHVAIRDNRIIGTSALDADGLSRWDAFAEVDRQTVTRLIFHEDRRFQEASKLVNQTRPPVVECSPNSGWSESDLLEAQKELAQHVTKRTLSVATGRGMMHFNARTPLLTERVPIPAFSLQCVMKPQSAGDSSQAMTFSADKALFTEDKVCWAFFHNGASAGLTLSREAKWIDTSWILYNKPPDLTNRHAGFLLALGLNGHLKSVAKWVAFKYLTPKHTMTSIGLLLGLASSYLGTSDTLITRLLSVHVTRLLPPGAAELNLSPLTQTSGIMGIGLLYYNSQHRRMSEVMLSEIENYDSEENSGDDPILRDEGYRLAAGFSLGLVNLGYGNRLHSLHDMGVLERLLSIAVGTKNVNHVHVLDRATAGAVIAIAFLFMKTNDSALAHKIDIPDTLHQFDYVRPDIFLLRTLARHLIMWDAITPSVEFIRSSLPQVYSLRADLTTTKRLTIDDMPFFNIIAGVCFALSLRFAGTHRHDVRDLLVHYLDQFLRLTRLPALNYDSRVTLNSARNCLDVVALSAATVMAGSGDLIVMRRLRALHGRTDKETPFGSHLAGHMALGTLFLAGGTATFGTSNLAVASLVIAFYPVFPIDVLDNRGHLQALRHLWVLAVDSRCLVTREVETGTVLGGIKAVIHSTNGTSTEMRTPGLLPDFDLIKKIQIKSEAYWDLEIELDKKDSQSGLSLREMYNTQSRGISLSLQRRSIYDRPENDAFMSELQALDEARAVPSTDPNNAANERWRNLPTSVEAPRTDLFEWVFDGRILKALDHAERTLVLGSHGSSSSIINGLLRNSTLDARLEFEVATLGPEQTSPVDDSAAKSDIIRGRTFNRDKLWQLRLLLTWSDRWEEMLEQNPAGSDGDDRDNRCTWLRKEVIEKLRWRLWKMSENGHDEY